MKGANMTENVEKYEVAKTIGFGMVDPSAIAAAEAAKAEIQAAYLMALHKPRNEMDARDRIINACKRTELAARVEYSKPVGNKKIKGPSIRLAEVALNYWGNVNTRSVILYEDESVRRIRVSCIDLENNITHSRDYTLNKTVERKSKLGREDDVIRERTNTYNERVYILKATEDEMATKEAAWISKGKRNEGLRLIPSDIIDEAMDTARKTIAEGIKRDPEGEKKKVLDAFSAIGIRPSKLEKYLNHTVASVSPAEIIDLRSVYQTIRDGETTWADYIALTPGENIKEKTKRRIADMKKKQPLDPTAGPPAVTVEVGLDSTTSEPGAWKLGHIWWRDNWINLRGAGYSTFCHQNLKSLHEAPQEIIDEAMAKWTSLYPNDPCPFNAAGRPVEKINDTETIDDMVDVMVECIKIREGETFIELIDLLRQNEKARAIFKADFADAGKMIDTEDKLKKTYEYVLRQLNKKTIGR